MSLKNNANIRTPLHLKISSIVVASCLAASGALAQHGGAPGSADPPAAEAIFPGLAARQAALEAQGWLLRGQATFIEQATPGFRAPYRGENSLQSRPMQRNTLSADLVIGRRLWHGAEAIVVPQISRGFGLSGTRGLVAFPNGEAFRKGSEDPTAYVTRAFIRQTIGLSSDVEDEDDAGPLRFAGALPRERVTITAGKISIFDIFDANRYSHDPRTQFLNWAFVSAGAFDFANDAKGYTNGLALEWEDGTWGVRLGALQVARRINSLSLDPQPGRGFQLLAQLDRFWTIGNRPGAARLLGGLSRTRSQSWRALIEDDLEATEENPTGGYARKWMAVLNLEQELAEGLGAFARLSWNDGRTQQWMYTEMDWAVSAGVAIDGLRWGRAGDTLGLAGNIGGLSRDHRRFLQAGGIGFIAGDGRLNYSPEVATEAYYDVRIAPGTRLAANVQLIVNPAHNADRGPVPVFGLRLRTAF